LESNAMDEIWSIMVETVSTEAPVADRWWSKQQDLKKLCWLGFFRSRIVRPQAPLTLRSHLICRHARGPMVPYDK